MSVRSIAIAFCKVRHIPGRFVPPHGRRITKREKGSPRNGWLFYCPLEAIESLEQYLEAVGPNGRVHIQVRDRSPPSAVTVTVDAAIRYVENSFYDPKQQWGRAWPSEGKQ